MKTTLFLVLITLSSISQAAARYMHFYMHCETPAQDVTVQLFLDQNDKSVMYASILQGNQSIAFNRAATFAKRNNNLVLTSIKNPFNISFEITAKGNNKMDVTYIDQQRNNKQVTVYDLDCVL